MVDLHMGGIPEEKLNKIYLRLDCSNDPLTETLHTESIIPSADATYDIGESGGGYWRYGYFTKLWISSTFHLDGSFDMTGDFSITGDIHMTGNLYMDYNKIYTRYDAANDYSTIYDFSGALYLNCRNVDGSTALSLTDGSSGEGGGMFLGIGGILHPVFSSVTDGNVSFGNSNHRWKDLYLSGKLSDSTNELTVANAKAAYDHSQLVAGNPHVVTPAEVGNTTAQWNADKLQGFAIESSAPVTGNYLKWTGVKWDDDDIDLDKVDDGLTYGRVLSSELDFGEIKDSAIDHDQTTNVHQDVNTTASPEFVDLTLTDDFYPSAKGMTIPLPASGVTNYVFNMVGQLTTGLVFHRTGATTGNVEMIAGGTVKHEFKVMGAGGGDYIARGAISSGVKTIASSSDDFDVSGANTLFVDTSEEDIIIGGLKGGVAGQVLYVAMKDTRNTCTLEHLEGVGTQDIYLCDDLDETLDDYGGWVLICDGSNWYDCSHAKHV